MIAPIVLLDTDATSFTRTLLRCTLNLLGAGVILNIMFAAPALIVFCACFPCVKCFVVCGAD
jgi:hypothetical protein